MANDKINLFWEIFKSVSGGTGNITDALDAIAKSDRTKLEDYFSNVVDQSSFLTSDYNRLRKLIIDLFATHRSLATSSLRASDVHSMSNSDLDELFRSFGYPHSTSLRDFDENPLEQKIQFFLDLVNLYKVKGTPQSLVDVLQYYGVTEVDIYEFFLKKSSPSSLYFEGKVVAGTTTNPIDITFPYLNLTQGDPHWLYTADQILELDKNSKVNLPSKTPYIGVQPIVEVDSFEMTTIVRRCHDEFDYYRATGTVPTASAEITYIGELRSFLELYLSSVYMFNKLFSVGRDTLRFMCYDGTSSDPEIIKAEFDELLNVVPTSRLDQKQKYAQFLDQFTRTQSTPTYNDFLVNSNSASYWLGTIAPDIKAQLDSAGEPLEVLYSLLKDMALWVRANIGYGFVNFGFILFGIQEFFKTLSPAINFFKPYRARILLLEQLQVKSRIPNSIVIEDAFDFYGEQTVHDFITGNSIPCCGTSPIDSTSTSICSGEIVNQCKREFTGAIPPVMNWRGIWQSGIAYSINDVVPDLNGNQYICTQVHVSNDQTKPPTGLSYSSFWSLISTVVCDSTAVGRYYSRDTFDCGSAFDYGAVVSGADDVEITYEETIHDHLVCPPADTTGFVYSEITNLVRLGPYSHKIREGVPSTTVLFDSTSVQPDINYVVVASLRNNNTDEIQYVYDFIVTNKETTGFTVDFTGEITSDHYYLDWFLVDSTSASSGITPLDFGDASKDITVPNICGSNYNIIVSLVNTQDLTPSIYSHSVTQKSLNEFQVDLSGPMDSTNYHLEWMICEGLQRGNGDIPQGASEVTVYLNTPLTHTHYPILINLSTDSTSEFIISGIVKKRYENRFVVLLSAPVPTDDYQISWLIPYVGLPPVYSFDYYQTGGFRDFDTGGRFDCTHGFDYFTIRIEEITGFLLQENGAYLLQENGARIIL
jgi:hypothetical protein